MVDISRLGRLIGGAYRGVDLSTNTLVVGSLKVGATELTETILGRLISLQNGTDVGSGYHTHDGLYTRSTDLASTANAKGASLIGVEDSANQFTATNVESALAEAKAEIDTHVADSGTKHNAARIAYQRTDGSKKDIQAGSDDVESSLTDLDDAKISKTGSIAFTGDQPMGTHKFTGLSAGSSAGHSVRYEQAILVSGANAFGANQSFGGFKATNLADPTASQDGVTLSYMNARLLGLAPKRSARVASTANITLASALINGAVMDGITLATGDRALLKDQTAPEENGLYIVAASGAASRATDMDSLSPIDEVNGSYVPVQLGTANAGKVFVQYGVVATLGTDAVNFEVYNPLAGLSGGDMIAFTSGVFSVDLASTSGLESSNAGNAAGQLRVKLEASNPSLQIDGSNQLGAKLDAAGTITSGASGLKVGVDGSTIEINSNALRVKALGIGTAQLAANAADGTKIRLANNEYLRARNAANSADVNIARVNASDVIEFASIPQAAGTPSSPNDLVNKAYADALTSVPETTVRVAAAGESFSAATLYAVRWGRPADSETAGRLYKADYDASSVDNFHVVGVIKTVGALSAGDPMTVTKSGKMTAASHGFTVGQPIWLAASGAVSGTAVTTSDSGKAAVQLGQAETSGQLDIQIAKNGVA